ncbi:STAS domain-containing protein [Streptomyces actinomycinicus]|uniref:Anti-sigma factor antagonist n=1 Tax=Streptomyces actinomycinicus TaxID=1695166 RepID=A0A937EKG1_9ACTN|nr:STAS domain-containing protein [Streptomyces actinomycinicus]MBL1083705.1 STAS domain-containing protein [Streptomyces actinomycinicus]
MSSLPPTEFSLTVRCEATTLTVLIGGELDHETSDELLSEVSEQLSAGHPPFRDVHLDFGKMTFIDSSGLTALLMIHRRTSAIGAGLHLDNRPPTLERMLQLTNVLDHLTTPPTRTGDQRAEEDDGAGVT